MYNNVSMLKNTKGTNKLIRGAMKFIKTLIETGTKEISLKLEVPTVNYIRTELLCDYISDIVKVEFGIDNFLMAIYLDFITDSIRKYDPLKIHRVINKSNGYGDIIKISCGKESYTCSKRNESMSTIYITMDKKDAAKGNLLLSELNEFYSHEITLERLLSALWINFVEEYKKGDNNKALTEIIKMLKKVL